MFENGQDTNLLRNSIISSSQCLKKYQESCSLKDEKTAVEIVVSTIKTLSSNLHGINTFHELFQKQKNIKQRCHAVVLINLLKSQNICCSEADNFYQTVLYDVDNISWSYYLQLNFLCSLSEYFIECACQLQPDVLSVVLKKILEVQCEGELKSYACHLALQAYIRKAFELHSTSIVKPNTEVNFAFNFCVPKSSVEGVEHSSNKSPPNHLHSTFHILFNQIKSDNIESDINNVKVVLHGVKTIFKLLNNISSDRTEDGSGIERLSLLSHLLFHCLTPEEIESCILQSMQKPFGCLIDSGYQLMSWEINEVYLIFLLQNFWKDFKTRPMTNPESKTPLKTISSYCRDLHAYMEQNNLSCKTVTYLNERYLNISSKTRESYFLLMTVIVKHHYVYASRAAECLLSNPEVWEQYKVIDVLEENVSILNPVELQISLADAIVEPKSKDVHDRLLNIFYKVLSQAAPEIYNITLENILKNWGFCEYFMLPNFNAQLTQLSRKTMSLKEEDTLLPLFVQSSKVVLQFLIEQAMMQGIDGMEALKVLKSIPVACVYVCPDEPVTPPLIAILSPYFEHSLRANETKHFMILLKTLMELQVTEDIICFDLFLDKCILPNSLIQNVNQLEFTLECLHASLDVLINNHALEVSDVKYISLLKHLSSILGYSMDNSLGKIKETVVDIMKLLSKYKRKPQLDDLFKKEEMDSKEQLSDSEDFVKLYVIGIFFKEINPDHQTECNLLKWKNRVIKEDFQCLWIWCCVDDNIDDFVDNVSLFELNYVNLLEHLPSILWHSTRSEWLQATKLIMYCQNLMKIGASDYTWLLPDSDPELYGVIRCLIDSFTFMMKERSSRDIVYCSSCLTNTIITLLDKKTIPPSLLVNVFIDICCASSYIDFEVFFMFSSVLMSLQKQYLSVCSKTEKKDCIKLMKLSLDSIQNDAVDKESLKDKFCQM